MAATKTRVDFLQQFCGTLHVTDKSTLRLGKPWRFDGYRYASDARIIVRIPDDRPNKVRKDHVGAAITSCRWFCKRGLFNPRKLKPLSIAWAEYHFGDIHVEVFGKLFDLKYINQILQLKNVRGHVEGEWLVFQFPHGDGFGQGLLMRISERCDP